MHLVAKISDLLGLSSVLDVGVCPQMHRVFFHQKTLDGENTGVVQVHLVRGSIRFQRIDNLASTHIEGLLAGLAKAQVDQNLIIRGDTVGLNLRVFQTGTIHVGAHCLQIRRARELHVDQGAAAEVDSPGKRSSGPSPSKPHGNETRDTEDQRESKEVPLLAEKIDVDVMKELHRSSPLSQIE